MLVRAALMLAMVLAAGPVVAAPPSLAFRPAGEGLYEFHTGPLKGRLKLDGKYQGLYPLVDAASGAELVHPPGIFSFYRVFSGNTRFGANARDWPTTSKLLSDGAVEVRFPSAKEHPLEITGVYRWKAADTLDLDLSVRPEQAMPRFELFMSSYFGKTFVASVYLKPEGAQKPGFVPVDRKPQSPGAYVMFPRDAQAVEMIRDGRWKVGANPVDWAIEQWLAAPIFVRRDASAGLTALMICPPEDCFAVSSPWNPAKLDAPGYRSVYLSLFGRDLQAGQTAKARCRVVIARNLPDEKAMRRYQEYLGEQKR